MKRYFYTHEESEAYREGRIDESSHRHNFERDRYSNKPEDEAYFLGRNDAEQAERENREQQEWENRMREEAERHREEQRRRDEEYEIHLQQQMEEQMEAERAYYEAMANEYPLSSEPEPITEEELFMDIQEDERNQYDNFDIKEEIGYSDAMQEEIDE